MTTTNRARDEEKLFDLLAPAYEILASKGRVTADIDALDAHLKSIGARRILDAGTAAGHHAVELARRGYSVTGIDLSPGMIREAKKRASAAGVKARFFVRDFVAADPIPGGPFDAVICMGNTISYIPTARERHRVLRYFRQSLRPGGLLLLQLRDLSRLSREGHVFPTRSLIRGGEEWILLRRQDRYGQTIRFLVTLLYRRDPNADWQTLGSRSDLKIIPASAWRGFLTKAGFTRVRAAVDLRGTPRRKVGGPDLVLFSRRG